MDSKFNSGCPREFDFALIVGGVSELTPALMDAMYAAGCDDATLSIQYGLLYMEFSRSAMSLKDAILSAIRDVQKSGTSAKVLRVDECNLVTQSDIARRINRTRQLVHQYISGERGPGGFPPPECHLSDRAPLWPWCAVSYWLVQNNLLRPEEGWNANVVYAINECLEAAHQPEEFGKLMEDIAKELEAFGV
ncbi:MAG: hypothetical protein IT432_15045 [Phycisphaerales bacterium]|nr:hypothetical protein [Phycisphaerales bacterium]